MSTYRQFLPALLLVCLLAAGLASPVQAEPDRPPVCASPIPNQTIDVGVIYRYTVPSSTFLGWPHDVIEYSSTLTSGDPLPAWLTFTPFGTRINQNPGQYSGTPDAVQILFIRTYAADDDGGVGFCDWSLTVRPANTDPVLASPISDQFTQEDQPYSFTVPAGTFSNADSWDTLTFSAGLSGGAPLPAWLTFNSPSGLFSGTPGNDDTGSLDITVTATDTRGSSASDTFTLTVQNVNDSPTALGIADTEAYQDVPFSYALAAGTFSDVDAGDVLEITTSALPAWLSFDAASLTFSGTPANADVGSLAVTVTAADLAGASASAAFTIVVQNVNDAPYVLNLIPPDSHPEDALMTCSFAANTFADPDLGDNLTYTAELASGGALPAWMTFDPLARTFTGTPTQAEVGLIQIRITATDAEGQYASAILDLTITNVNDAPLAGTVAAQRVEEYSAYELVLPASSFSDEDPGDTLTCSAAGLPGWLSFDTGTWTFSGSPTHADLGSFTVTITCEDSAAASAMLDVDFEVFYVTKYMYLPQLGR